ncbi:MAG: nucleotidyltransferase domain-containing protein, partial [Caldilineaceae bacterium]|nr:nucleotidyltransferase domain-containing protein [Caldilineaceae bacterium]
MIEQTTSYELTLDETARRLAAAPQVEGIALFGSHSMAHNNPVSDYDLLLLVDAPPVEIFQMLTHIDGRMADIVISTVDTAQHVLTLATPVSIHTAEGMLIHKLWAATIVHDPHARLAQIRQHLHRRPKCTDWLMGTNVEEQYATWFWQNHSLLHIKRMCHSTEPLYLTAADMMLVTGLAGLCRSYFVARQLS